MKCNWHLCQVETDNKYCSRKCKNKSAVDRFRKNLKRRAVDYKGGKCVRCSYSRCLAALEFHHVEPEHKDFAIGSGGHTRSWERVRQELDKCILVCSNCHAEIHNEIG